MEMRNLEIRPMNRGDKLSGVAEAVEIAMRYKSKIEICADSIHINGKSFMGMTLLESLQGRTATVIAEGPDEAAAVEDFTAALQGRTDRRDTTA